MSLKTVVTLYLLLLSSRSLAGAQESRTKSAESTGHRLISTSIAELPLAFEPNLGQGPQNEQYLAHAGALRVGLSKNAISLTLTTRMKTSAVAITFAGANRSAPIETSEPGVGESNYLIGSDPSAWKTHVPQFGRVTYRGIYPGIDLAFYGAGGRMEHDFIVQPGADYRQVRMRFEGARALSLTRAGDLRVATDAADAKTAFIVHAPRVYQIVNGSRRAVAGRMVLSGRREVRFQLGAFDPTSQLVIDPVLDYATYLANLAVYVDGVATDTAGNSYIAGLTFSASYPVTKGAYQTTCPGCASREPVIFITKLNPAGSAAIYSTFLGGSNYNEADSIAVDASGDALVAGYTQSADFPLENPVASGTPSYDDGFAASLAPDGASLNFSSRLGGSDSQNTGGPTFPAAIVADHVGNVYIAGTTNSSYIPTTPGALKAGTPDYNDSYVFLTKLKPTGGLVYGAVVGATGSASDCCSVAGLAVDFANNAYIGGTVGVTDYGAGTATPWPISKGAYQSKVIAPGQTSPFAAKVSPDGRTLLYSTLVTCGEATAMALTPNGQVILTGNPNYNFPVTPNAYSSFFGTSFIAELSADATKLDYASYFSNKNEDTDGYIANAAVDAKGNLWIAGNTGYSPQIPLKDPLQSLPGSSEGSPFVTEFNPTLEEVLFSTYFNGAEGGTSIDGMAIDSSGRVHIAGAGESDLPTTPGVYLGKVGATKPGYSAQYAFAALIDPNVPGPGICFSDQTGGYAEVGASSPVSFAVTNCGSAPLTISSIKVASNVFSLPAKGGCAGTLGAGEACTVTATFKPIAAGQASATVTVNSDATIASYSIPILGTGTAPKIAVYPGAVNFAEQVLGVSASGAAEIVFIGNSGTANLIVNTAKTKITGDFQVAGTTCASPLPLNANCSYTVSFVPTALGARSGTLTIVSNSLVDSTLVIPLAGTAVAKYPAPTLTSLGFTPSVALGSTGTSLTVYGANFFPTSLLTVGGEPLPTTYAGSSSLTATIDSSLLSTVGELPVQVVNPSPGGRSNSLPWNVYRALNVTAASLVYNPATGLLYASIPAASSTHPNTVLPINPLTGVEGTPIPVGSNPDKLALSSDGAYLFVALDGSHSLQRINLAKAKVERNFALPPDSEFGPTIVQDMHGVPGSPESVVASLSSLSSLSEAGTALFNDSGLVSYLPNDFATNYSGIDSFTFTANPSILYAYPFSGSFFTEIGVSATALKSINGTPGGCCDETTGSLVASDGTLLYTNSGEVWNPQAQKLQGTYTISPNSLFYEPSVVPDTPNQRTYMLDTSAGYFGVSGFADILSFNQKSYALAGSVSIALQSYPSIADLVRWGSDGFAFRSNAGSPNDQIVLLRSSLTHTATGGTPSLSALSPATATVGAASAQVAVEGKGFLPGTTVFWNGVALETAYVSPTQLTALVPGSNFATAGQAKVTAQNQGGGTSTALNFNITAKP